MAQFPIDRRTLLTMGAVSGAGAVALLGGTLGADEAGAADLGENARSVAALKQGVTYLGIDCLAFWPDADDIRRIYQHLTGTQPLPASNRLHAPLMLPVGSAIVDISASYFGQPIVEINRRPLYDGGTAQAPGALFQQTMPASSAGPRASTLNVSPPVVFGPNATYLLSAYLTAGNSILGMRVGYRPPTQSFVPFTGASARIYDTRNTGGILQVGVPRRIPTQFAGARCAVFNLNVVQPAGRGFISCYASNAPVSNVPSVQYAAGQIVENLVICPLATDGSLKIKAAGAATHAFLDLIGIMI